MTTKSLLFTGYKYMFITFLTVVFLLFYYLGNTIIFLPPVFIFIALLTVILCVGIMVVKFIRTGTVEGVLKQIAITILETMSSQDLLKSSIKNVGLHVMEDHGRFFVSCSNLPAAENNLFIQALQELLDPVENPRYLLVKHGSFWGKVRQTDYFAIPSILSVKRKSVEMFKQLWEKYIGKCEVVYTRNLEGRKLLLKARREASSAIKRRRSERLSKWQ